MTIIRSTAIIPISDCNCDSLYEYNNKACENIRVPPFNMQWGAGGGVNYFEIIIINVLDNGIALSARDRLHTSYLTSDYDVYSRSPH